jgi:hypothetical protein
VATTSLGRGARQRCLQNHAAEAGSSPSLAAAWELLLGSNGTGAGAGWELLLGSSTGAPPLHEALDSLVRSVGAVSFARSSGFDGSGNGSRYEALGSLDIGRTQGK